MKDQETVATIQNTSTNTMDGSKRPNRILGGLSDWIHLLDGPQNRAFAEIVTNEDWARLLRLLTICLLLSGAVVGVVLSAKAILSIQAVEEASADYLQESRAALIALIIGAMLGIAYRAIAVALRIPISVTQTFFIILALGLPWIPIITSVEMIPSTLNFTGIYLVWILGNLLLLKAVINFYRGIRIITKCERWRVLVSIIMPVIVLISLLVYIRLP